MNKTLLPLLTLLIFSCGTSEKKSPSVYFAGEIVNPTTEYVVLYKGDTALDSVKLDEDNRFVLELDSINEGLHHFYHSPELQYVYLEKGDSLQIRLNTYYFDESLVFSGVGEDVNNFLIEMFLSHEKEEELVYDYYKLEPEEFCNKIDSLSNEKLVHLDEINTEHPLSDKAMALAKAGVDYKTFRYKEPYPYYHKKKKGEKSMHKLPDDFYSYHGDVDFENEDLTYLRPYYNFMRYHLGNLSYMDCKKNCNTNDKHLIENQLHFSKHQMYMIDSLVHQKELRDNLFRNVAYDYLLNNDSEENKEVFITKFHEHSGNNKHIEEIDRLYTDIKNLQPENELPDVTVFDIEGAPVKLPELCKGKEQVVFYFWSAVDKGQFKKINERVTELKSKYPEYTFIGINLRTDMARWKTMLEEYEMDKEQQYWADSYKKVTHALVIYDPYKSIITKDGRIVNAFANVYSSF